jgi:hypothetical protein
MSYTSPFNELYFIKKYASNKKVFDFQKIIHLFCQVQIGQPALVKRTSDQSHQPISRTKDTYPRNAKRQSPSKSHHFNEPKNSAISK